MLEYESPQVSTLGGNPYGPGDKGVVWCKAVLVVYVVAAAAVAVVAAIVLLLLLKEGEHL